MKKMMFIALAAATFTFASCWTDKKTDVQESDETEVVDTTVAPEGEDNAATDSTAAKDENAESSAEGTEAPAEETPAADAK